MARCCTGGMRQLNGGLVAGTETCAVHAQALYAKLRSSCVAFLHAFCGQRDIACGNAAASLAMHPMGEAGVVALAGWPESKSGAARQRRISLSMMLMQPSSISACLRCRRVSNSGRDSKSLASGSVQDAPSSLHCHQ